MNKLEYHGQVDVNHAHQTLNLEFELALGSHNE